MSSSTNASGYNPIAADMLAVSLRAAAQRLDGQANLRASLRASLLSDCWAGSFHDNYEADYSRQQPQASELCSQLLTLAGRIDDLSAQTASAATAAASATPPSSPAVPSPNTPRRF